MERYTKRFVESEDTNEPDEEDIVITSKSEIFQNGKLIGKAVEWEDQKQIISDWMDKNQFFPTVWIEDDHGGYTPTSLED